MKKKKIIVIVVLIILVLAGVAAGIFVLLRNKNKDSDEVVYVESVAELTGSMYIGDNRYMGIVESQEVKEVQKDSDKTVKTVFVEVEDEVKEGDKLFEYDTEEMTLKLRQLELELTSIYNGITTMNQQINSLAAERDQAPAENKLEYTAQIQNLQAQVNQSNYDASAKQLEIDRQSAAIQNSIVYAPMDGIIKEVNDGTDSSASSDDYDYDYDSGSSSSNAFISIMAKGDYRVKATASEMNVRSMSEGQAVIVRSRMDETITWTGVISKIDLEHPDNSSDNDYYYYSSGESATKYPFYIDLDSTDDLMLGQHLYVEMDYGQGEVKEGIWLDEWYIMQEDDGAYVWAEDSDGRIEKRKVELGEYDEDLMQYQILSGLSESDYIAYPEARIKEGMKTTHNYEDVMMDMYEDGDMYDEYMGEEYMYDEYMDEEYMYASPTDGDMYDEYMEDEYMDEEYMEDEYADDIPDNDVEDLPVDDLELPVRDGAADTEEGAE